jgi:pimeloyl-ACP methyl ester carboxylesterase
MDTLWYTYAGLDRPCCLVIFLPGRWDSAAHYEQEQFIEAVRQAGLAVDMVAVEAHYGYYTRHTVVERLKADVVAPAQAKGYEQLWLVGISLGGFGALLYAKAYPDDVTGLVVLAPFLGEAEVIQEVASAGGVRQWMPTALAAPDRQRQLWQWLKSYTALQEEVPRLYLGYGQSDRFASAHALLAAALPPAQVLIIPGGHAWSTWRLLWYAFLTTSGFPRPR